MGYVLIMDTEGKEAKLAYIRSKMSQIEKVIAGLNGVTTKVDYILVSDENIKASDHLAGKKYQTLTEDEENILKNIESVFNNKRSTIIEELNAKYRELQSEAAMLL